MVTVPALATIAIVVVCASRGARLPARTAAALLAVWWLAVLVAAWAGFGLLVALFAVAATADCVFDALLARRGRRTWSQTS